MPFPVSSSPGGMSPKRYDPPKGVIPEKDSDDWLWYRPIDEGKDQPKPEGEAVYFTFFSCDTCVVNWKQWISNTIRGRCFSCGTFQRKPF